MVHIYRGELLPKLKASQPGKRMPVLCAVNRTFGWKILSENMEEHEKAVRSEIFDVNEINKENYLTSMAVSDDTDIIAIGSGCNNGALYFIRDYSAIKDIESGPRFKALHKETLKVPIHSLDWSGNHLLVGTNQGVTRMYQVVFEQDSILEFTCIGQYTNSPSEISIYAPAVSINTHVKSAEFSSNYSSSHSNDTSNPSSHFLTTTMNRVSVWDTQQVAKPIMHVEASGSLLNCASWSPNDPQSLIACGGYDKKLTIIDTRISPNEQSSIVWSVENAHDRPIRDCKFNPYIPYWLASAGEDSMVNIWDIRATYHAPVAKIDGLMNMAISVTWSIMRPENIGTASSDGIVRYWTLSPESFPLWDTHFKIAKYGNEDTLPISREFEEDNIWCVKGHRFRSKEIKSWIEDDDEGIEQAKIRSTKLLAGAVGLGQWGKPEPGTIYKGEENVQSKGTVLCLKPAKLRPSMYYCITTGGQLAAHTIRFNALSNLRNRHRFDPKDKNELAAQIEDDIYCRRIYEAERKLNILRNTTAVDKQAEGQRLEEIDFLEDCLKVRDPIKFDEWGINSLPDISSRRVSRRLWNDEDKWDMAIQKFKSDLKYWSYRIPPGLDTKYRFPLNLNEPIIAPHLLEQSFIHTELPAFVDRSPRPSYLDVSDDVSFVALDSPVESKEEEEKTKPVLTFTNKDDSGLIDVRRKSHTPPTITISDSPKSIDYQQKNGIEELHRPVPNTTSPISNNNPFENQFSESEIKPNTNPFEITPLVPEEQSTNPFENDFDSTKQNNRASHVTIEENDSKRRSSWIHSGHRLSLSLSHHSNYSEDSKASTTNSSKSHHKFNPFKRVLSRGSTKSEESEEMSRNMLERNSSSRRNALHGPF